MSKARLKLSESETELIEILRGGKPFSVTIQNDDRGQWVCATSAPPFVSTNLPLVGIGFTFAEAWRGKLDPRKLPGVN